MSRWAWPTLEAALLLGAFTASPAAAQLSPDSWWPKFQRDTRNSGAVPLIGFVGDAHVLWSVRLSGPITHPGENHATPVFSPDDTRLYVGGPHATLSAVDIADGSVAWTVTLGAGAGTVLQTAAIAADGSIYVGAWNGAVPFDGFSKVQDDGDHATVVWTFPLRGIASPTITSDGLIIVGGQHETDGWGYFALEDLGESYTLVWTAGQLGDPLDPLSTGWVGASPALSLDETWVYGGSYQNRTFWQIETQTGVETARVALDQYCYAPSPVVSDDDFVFVGEGMSFSDPDDATEGKLYVMERNEQDITEIRDARPLYVGHLNGGTAAVHRRANGQLRLYVPANGFGKSTASLVAVDFDPYAPPEQAALKKAWTVSNGGSRLAYPQAVVTRDELVYVLGPGDHLLRAVRDADDHGATQWTVSLGSITRVEDWQPGSQIGPRSVVVGPDGTLYWNAVDGYLYALRGWLSGDLDADGWLTTQDLDWLVTAIVDAERYELLFPEIDAAEIGDLNGDNRLDFFDVNRMIELLGAG